MSDKSFTFNWHEEPEGFMKWAWVTLMGDHSDLSADEWREQFEHLMDVTDDGKQIELTIHANGVEMDANQLMIRLYENHEHYIKRKVQGIVKNDLRMEQIQDTIREAERAAQKVIRERMKAVGIEWDYEDEGW